MSRAVMSRIGGIMVSELRVPVFNLNFGAKLVPRLIVRFRQSQSWPTYLYKSFTCDRGVSGYALGLRNR